MCWQWEAVGGEGERTTHIASKRPHSWPQEVLRSQPPNNSEAGDSASVTTSSTHSRTVRRKRKELDGGCEWEGAPPHISPPHQLSFLKGTDVSQGFVKASPPRKGQPALPMGPIHPGIVCSARIWLQRSTSSVLIICLRQNSKKIPAQQKTISCF